MYIWWKVKVIQSVTKYFIFFYEAMVCICSHTNVVRIFVDDYGNLFTDFFLHSIVLFISAGNTKVYFVSWFDENLLAYCTRSIRSKGIQSVMCSRGKLLILMPYADNLCAWRTDWELSENLLAVVSMISVFLATLNQTIAYSPNITGIQDTYMISHINFVRINNMNVLHWQRKLL